MRNWNGCVIGAFFACISLPDYLWGIETYYCRQCISKVVCFQTTYEELKRETEKGSKILLVLPDYLWGIETSLIIVRGRGHPPLPDYLWGIETTNELRLLPLRFRFQTTYEELKPCYEGRQGSGKTACFQTTYEELKPYASFIAEANIPASRLPMRNWNIHARNFHFAKCHASRLPMRNWNPAKASWS